MDSKTNIKDRLKMINKSLFNRHEGRFVKAATAALVITTLTYNFAFAKEETPTLNQIYHVYVGNQYMGAVESQKTIANLILQKEEEASNQYKELSVDAGANIKVIPELVYRSAVNTEATLTKVNEALVVEADAYKVTVNGETVAYLKNANEYDKVINQLKLQYVSESEISESNARKLSTEQLPPLGLNETRVLDIYVVENMYGEETKASPSEILSVEQVVELLKSGSIEQEIYTVQQGDVLGSIAKNHNLKVAELLNLNPDLQETTLLKIGQQLNITALKPYVSIAVVYENLKEEVVPYTTVTKDDNTILKGETKVVQAGVNGSKQAQYREVYVNGQRTEISTVAEKVTTEATAEIVHKGTKVIPSRGNGTFVWPTNGGYISSGMGYRWGSYHRGIDIARPSNYTIKAADNGTVSFAGWDGSYGRKVVINHNNGFQTVYAHLSSINVRVGQVVPAGSAIGVMGSTGNSTGVHLHFEVIRNGANVNPLSYLK
jgi:murein DD-endopeptidase MepM/ murein hydrolase activator NlpD